MKYIISVFMCVFMYVSMSVCHNSASNDLGGLAMVFRKTKSTSSFGGGCEFDTSNTSSRDTKIESKLALCLPL
jgi:hypothetical protein